MVDLSLMLLQIGDVDRCAVYISLAPGMENPAGVDPPEDDAADANPLGFLPDLLMRDGDNSVGGWR